DLSIYRQDELAVLFQWGWITNSGPNDYIRFPQVNDNISQVESILGPAGTVAKITHLTVYDGLSDEYRSAPWDIDRSRDTVIIYGQRLDSVTSIKVLDHNTTTVNGEYKTLQTIDARRHIMSDQQIVLPPGTLSDETVSPLTNEYYRRIALVNPKGDSDSEFIYEISDGRPLVMSAQYDGTHLNTAKSLIIRGSGFKLSQGFVNQIWFFEGDEGNGSYNLEPNSGIGMFDINNATAYPTPLAILDINPLNTGFTSSTGVPVNHSEIVVTDTMIYIPPHLISDGNYTFGKFGDLGESLDGRMSRSEASPNPGIDNWSRKIRVAYNSNATGQPDMSVILSPPRAHVQRFWSIGVGGDRNSSSGYSRTLPTITEVFTTLEDPAVNPGEQNSTWTRNDPGDFLVIRGTGLDLAKGINFVDGRGNPIQTIDTAGLTGGPPDAPIIMANLRDLPGPPSISNQADAGLLLDGVEIRTYPPLGRDGYEIRIQPVLFGLGAANVNYWDSETGLDPPNNQIGSRRVVIETPFGTAIAPRRQEIEIWFQP
ncbi:MAG: hypothetical protein QF685_12150, partial [Verrucomicrobiota bacterium]|nr:hypothetical protein [Verrucomicrobiota bacterium]